MHAQSFADTWQIFTVQQTFIIMYIHLFPLMFRSTILYLQLPQMSENPKFSGTTMPDDERLI